jgi:hypothetical protein
VRASALLLALLGCATPGSGSVAPYDDRGLFVRNRGQEILCQVRIAPSGERSDLDRLEPSEVIAPGGSRYFPLAEGTHAVELLDCNGDVILRRSDVRVGTRGAMLSFEER